MHKEKISQSLVTAERTLESARHILKVIMPISGDQKIILKSLEKAYECGILTISFILKYEHLKREIKLSKKKGKNIETFFDKCAFKYGLNESDKENLRNLIFYGKKHNESNLEFSRKDRVVIVNDNLDSYEINKERLESYILTLEKLLNSISHKGFN